MDSEGTFKPRITQIMNWVSRDRTLFHGRISDANVPKCSRTTPQTPVEGRLRLSLANPRTEMTDFEVAYVEYRQ
ncbi:hypothetical protein PM082_010385 [Marasmius tenuissimus]|nr:hypothetical protein PM082_010385 [Marasmius tenuissimus]